MELVAGVLGVECPFLLGFLFRPGQEERELGQLGIFGQRRVQAVDPGQAVVGLEAAGRHVGQHEGLLRRQDAHLLLLGEVALRVQSVPQPQVDKLGRLFGQHRAPVGRVERIDGNHVDHGVRADDLALNLDYPFLVRHQVDHHGGGIGQEVQIGEVAAGGGNSRDLGLRARSRFAGLGNASSAELLSAFSQLFARFRRANGPGIEQERRPFQHVARILLLPAAVQDVAILIADVAPGEIDRFRVGRVDAGQFLIAHPRQVGERREGRLVARGEDVHARERRQIPEPDSHPVGVGGDGRDLHRLQGRQLQVPQLAQDMVAHNRTVDDPDADPLAGGLEPKIVVPRRQTTKFQHAVANAQSVEAIGPDGVADHLEQRQLRPRRLGRGAEVGEADDCPGPGVDELPVRVPIERQRPGVSGPFRAGRRHAHDVAQGSQIHPALSVGLQRRLHRLAEVAVLESQLHRPVRFRFPRPAEQLDGVVGAELGQVQVLRLLRPFDLVQGERLPRGQVERLVLAQALDPGLERHRERGQPGGHAEFMDGLAVLEQPEVGDLG